MERNPFPFPVPAQSGTVGNDVYRTNAWLALYVPRSMVGQCSLTLSNPR